MTGMNSTAFRQDEKTRDAVLRNLEVIGEAAKRIPNDIRIVPTLARHLERPPSG